MRFQKEVIRVKFDKMGFRKEMGQIIRDFREHASLNQTDVADSIGLSRTAYVNIEQGAQGLKIEHLVKLAILFNIEPGYIIPKLFVDNPKEIS